LLKLLVVEIVVIVEVFFLTKLQLIVGTTNHNVESSLPRPKHPWNSKLTNYSKLKVDPSSQIAKHKTFTNYFCSKPFSQIGLVLNLLHKLVGLWTLFVKNTCFSHTCIIKKKNTWGNSFDPHSHNFFEFVPIFWPSRNVRCVFLCLSSLFAKPNIETFYFLTLRITLLPIDNFKIKKSNVEVKV